MSFLNIRSLSKRYGTVTALDDVDLSVASGSRTAIVGPSGSGKTTLLRIIAGFDTPDRGEVVLDDIVLADGQESVPAHRRGIGVVAQDGALFPHLTIEQNIGFGLDRRATDRPVRIRELMDMVGLDRSMLERSPDQLSGGQQQRVALARALAHKPRLMLLDEPFSALDTGLRAATRKAVAQVLSDAGIATILVTHDQGEALSFADQLAVMRSGKLVQVGSPQHVYLHPNDVLTAEFLGEALLLPAQLDGGQADCAFGRIAVNDKDARGPATIMIRPEQVVLMTSPGLPHSSGDAPTVEAVVVGLDFCGSTSELLLHIGGDRRISLRQPSSDAIAVGASVAIGMRGTAHVLKR